MVRIAGGRQEALPLPVGAVHHCAIVVCRLMVGIELGGGGKLAVPAERLQPKLAPVGVVLLHVLLWHDGVDRRHLGPGRDVAGVGCFCLCPSDEVGRRHPRSGRPTPCVALLPISISDKSFCLLIRGYRVLIGASIGYVRGILGEAAAVGIWNVFAGACALVLFAAAIGKSD